MSADPLFDDMHTELFAAFGRDGTVTRGGGMPVTVRVIVNEGVERIGEYGQSIGRVNTVDFRTDQYRPQQGDDLTLLDDAGAAVWTKSVASIDADDGYVTKAVMHG